MGRVVGRPVLGEGWSDVGGPGGGWADAVAVFVEDEQAADIDEQGDVLSSAVGCARCCAHDQIADARSLGFRYVLRFLVFFVGGSGGLRCADSVEESSGQVGCGVSWGLVPFLGEWLGWYVGLASAERQVQQCLVSLEFDVFDDAGEGAFERGGL